MIITFTAYENKTAKEGLTIGLDWWKWVQLCSVHDVRGLPSDSEDKALLDYHKDGPALVLGAVDHSIGRCNAAILSITALAIDLDHSTADQIGGVLQALAPFEYIVWTTHRHGSKLAGSIPRLRILIPLAAPITKEQHAAAWRGLNQMIGGHNDPATKDPARLHFLPSTFDPSLAIFEHHNGRWLDIADLPHVEIKASQSLEIDFIPDDIKRKLKSATVSTELKAAINKLLIGESFAQEPGRHDTMIKLTWQLAERRGDLSFEALRSFFASSLKKMEEENSDGAITIDQVFAAYQTASAKLEAAKQSRIEQARGATLYTQDELEVIAARARCTLEELSQRWIIQKDGVIYVLQGDGSYTSAIIEKDFTSIIRQRLRRAPIRLFELQPNGAPKYRPEKDVIAEYGVIADKVVCSLVLETSYYDPNTGIFYEACAPIKKALQPRFDPQIDEWLKLLAGEHYESICDWLACAPDLTRGLCGLYFEGTKGSGKTLLAEGLANLWSETAVAVGDAFSSFNADLARCPLVLADEYIPKVFGKDITEDVRKMLTVDVRTLNRKFRPSVELKGFVRLILTANNPYLLSSKSTHTADDIDAIADRFLYLKVEQPATDYLVKIGVTVCDEWKRRGIAEHVLWLRDNRTVQRPMARFWVTGKTSAMHHILTQSTPVNAIVQEWICRYIMAAPCADDPYRRLVRIEGGQVLINEQVIVDDLGKSGRIMPIKPAITTKEISAALKAIQVPGAQNRKQKRQDDGRRVWLRVIDTEHLLAWADEHDFYDREDILKVLKKST